MVIGTFDALMGLGFDDETLFPRGHISLLLLSTKLVVFFMTTVDLFLFLFDVLTLLVFVLLFDDRISFA